MARPSCHNPTPSVRKPTKQCADEACPPSCAYGGPLLVLAGNPNVGKSVVFQALTGVYVDVSNYPGTTVEVTHGHFDSWEVLDTPGVYGVSDFNEEERVAKEVIVDADTIVNVVDAVHLERDLFLTLQLLDMKIPMVVAMNMVDEARKRGVGVTAEALSEKLGVPVVETVATTGEGIEELKAAIADARIGNFDPVAAEAPLEESDEAYSARRERVNAITEVVVVEELSQATFAAKLSSWMLHPLTGVPILALILFVMYLIVGVGVSGHVVDFLEGSVMDAYWTPFIQKLVAYVTPLDSVIGEVLAGEFGILTMTPTYLIGVILPLVIAFYALLAILEDSGLLPRIAALADRALTKVGLNGRAVIPLILGLGCVTMATLTTRILGNKRERFIATALLAIAVPCSAQIAVIATLMTRTSPIISAVYFALLILVFALVGTALNKIMPGEPTSLLIDLPSMRVPRADNVLKKTYLKVKNFMIEVTAFFAFGALLMSTLKLSGILELIIDWARPLTQGWLHLPAEAATAFVMGFVRRDFGAAGFFAMDLTDVQLLVGMITITLFVPCLASTLVIFKERGWKYTLGVFLSSISLAFLVGGIVTRVAELF